MRPRRNKILKDLNLVVREERLELKLSQAAVAAPVESELVQKCEISLGLEIIIIVVSTILYEPEGF